MEEQEELEYLRSRANRAMHELHVPPAECEFYVRTIFDANQRDLVRAFDFVSFLTLVRERVLTILKSILVRESYVEKIERRLQLFHPKRATYHDRLQHENRLRTLLEALQSSTLLVVEAIHQWRSYLNHPFPFLWYGEDYFIRMRGDIDRLAGMETAQALKYPALNDPLLRQCPRPDHVDAALSRYDPDRIQRAEDLITEEYATQQMLRKRLNALRREGRPVFMLRWADSDPSQPIREPRPSENLNPEVSQIPLTPPAHQGGISLNISSNSNSNSNGIGNNSSGRGSSQGIPIFPS